MTILKPIYVSTIIFLQSIMLEGIILFQGSLIKPDDPEETDFLSKNPELIWGILIGVFLILTLAYVIYKKMKNKED